MSDYRPSVLLDLDGTLVDSVFLHVVAWEAALREAGHLVPMWRIHEGVGMGSSRLVPWLLGRHVEEASELADEHERRFLEHADQLQKTPGASELIEDLQRREVPFVIATSATAKLGEALREALGAPDLPTADADSVASPKPAPDLLLSAVDKLGLAPEHATLIGDSPWDGEAALACGVRFLAVRTGGFGDNRLLDGGASDVVDDPRALIGRL